MTEKEWKELEVLTAIRFYDLTIKQLRRRAKLIEKTRKIDEHPEDYNGGCECQSCMSYAD